MLNIETKQDQKSKWDCGTHDGIDLDNFYMFHAMFKLSRIMRLTEICEIGLINPNRERENRFFKFYEK